MLKKVGNLFQKIADGGSASALVYSYLGSVRSLQNQADDAIAAFDRATALNPGETFAQDSLKRLQEAATLQPKPGPELVGPTLEALRLQKLPGYDPTMLPPASRDINIAVLATGISLELAKELGPRLVHSSTTIPNERQAIDDIGHGTAVTALAAALAPQAKIISVKVLSPGTTATVVAGINSAIDQRANVILLPFGSRTPDDVIKTVIGIALDAGVLVVAAAGNESEQPLFPAQLSGVTAVGAVDKSGKLARFSNVGADVIYAPGVDILVQGQDSKLVRQSGTSFSAAIAAAYAAIVWAARPNFSAQQIRQLLADTAVDLGPVDPSKPELGRLRRIDVIAASRN
jgi:subtilisin family serine protease